MLLINIHHILPLSALVINFMVMAFVFAKDSKSPSNRSYLLFLIFLQIFCAGDLYLRFITTPNYSNGIFLKLFPISYLVVGFLFLNFIYVLFNKKKNFIYYMFFFLNVIVLLLHFFTDLIADGFEHYPWGNHISPGKLAIYTNSVLSLLPILFSLWFIAVETKKTESNDRRASLLFLFFGTTIAWSISGYSNIFYRTLFDSTEHIRLASSSSIIQTLFIIPALLKYNFLHKPIASIYHDLFNHSPDGVLITDSGGQIIKSNKIALEIIGDASNVNQLFDSKQFSIKSEYSNKEFHLLAGQTISLSQSKIMQGTLALGMLLIVRDITDKVEIQKALIKNENHLREAQSIANIGSFEYDLEFDKISWSDELFNLFGLDSKSFLPTNDYFLNNILHPDDKAYVVELIEKAYKNKSPLDYFHRIIRKDGDIRFMHSQAKIYFNETGVPIKINGTTQDITELELTKKELEQSEKEYKTLVETSPDSIIIANIDTFFYVNNAFVKMMRADSKDDFTHRTPLDFLFPENHNYVKDEVKKVLSGNPVEKKTFKYKRCDNTEGYIEIRGVLTHYKSKPAFLGAIRDVSEMINVQVELTESEKKYRFLIENSTDIIYNTDLDGNFTFVNSAFEKLSGYKKDQVIGKDSNIHVRSDFREKIKEIYHKQFITKSQNNVLEVPVIGKGGQNYWLELNVNLVWNGDKISGFTAVCRNITKRRKIAKELAEAHKKLESLFKAMPDIFFMLDFDGVVVEYKANDHNRLYVPPEQFLGKKVTDVLPKPASTKIQKSIDSFGENKKQLVTFEYSLQESDKIVYFEARLFPFQDKFIISIVRDITENKVLVQEQKEIEERYRLLVESSPDGVMLHNTQEVLFINEAALKLLGAPNKDVIIGRNPNSFIHDDYLEMENERTEKILNGENLDPIYEKMLRIDGTEVMVEAKGVLTHLEGKPVIQTTIRDVSQRIKAENEIKKSHDEIRKLAIHLQNLQEDERGQIAKEIHDELGQTLTGIKMDLSFLQQINDDESVCERLEVVDGLVDRTIKTVRKISSGLHPPVLDDLGLKAAIEWQTQEFFARSKINYVLDLPDYNIEFSKDKSRAIFRIIQESLTNVARHSNATTVTITSKVDNQNMIFSITDDGIGISQSVINENSTFGIISMKERALVFDGEVEITGNNKGTLVKLTIPLEKIGS